MKAVIFDIDGTLANLDHRLHFVTNGKHDWDNFFANVLHDRPVVQMIDLLNVLYEAGHKIIIVSGRSDRVKNETMAWFNQHGITAQYELYMRPDRDTRKDTIIKKQILGMIYKDFPDISIEFVVDDRPSVVKMWREEGLICLQCAEWKESNHQNKKGLLTLMVGPSASGKSTWLKNSSEVHASQIVSSDQIRAELCGNFRDQTKNEEVFAALHMVAKSRIEAGLATIVDATNIKRKDRLAIVDLAEGSPVRYIVIDRQLPEKLRDGGWRLEVPGLIERHHNTFQSQLKDILAGDNLPNVKVVDVRQAVK